MELMRPRRLVRLTTLAVIAVGPPIGYLELIDSAWAEAARAAVRSSPAAREQTTLPRPRPAAGSHEAEAGDDADPPALPESFRELAKLRLRSGCGCAPPARRPGPTDQAVVG